MKAVVIRNPGQGVEAWELVERERPSPGTGQVLVRIRAAALNYRDLMIAKGHYGGPLGKDVVALADGAGEVVALGPGVSRWRVGDRVASTYYPAWSAGPMRAEYFDHQLGALSSDGVLAEYAVLSETGIVRIPEHLSFEEASTLPCAAVTAWTALFESAGARAGSTVLVQGTGGVSIFAAQLALAAGARVIATTSSPAKAERLRALGVKDVIDYRATPEWHEPVRAATNGEGVDHVLDVGGAGTLKRSLEAVRVGGTIGLIGLLAGVGGTIDPLPVLFKGVRLHGIHVGSVASFEEMNRAISVHAIRPVIDDEVFSLDRASVALRKLQDGKHFGKIVVRIGD